MAKMFSPFNRLKNFVKLIEKKIPIHVRVVAELRLMWEDIVGATLAKRSQILRCEYLPKKDEQGSPTGEYSRRLVVGVKDNVSITALTTYASDYLDRIPSRFHIHSMRAVVSSKDFIVFDSQAPDLPVPMLVTDQEQKKIIYQVNSITLNTDLKDAMLRYLITCQNIRNLNK